MTTFDESLGAGVALIAASRAGARLMARLAAALPEARALVLERYRDAAGAGAEPLREPLGVAVGGLFQRCRGLVFFLPVGAVVRLIAPYLGDKLTDPAVVAVDDGGRFAVSVLSGHAGGGNGLAERIAALLGATPVITTALERRGLPAPEALGRPYGWRLEASRTALLRAAAALANGEPVAVYQEDGERDWLPPEAPVQWLGSLEDAGRLGTQPAIVITDRRLPSAVADRCVVWRPRRLVAGVGCSSGAPLEELAALLEAALAEVGYAPGAVSALATLDRRLGEPALRALAERLGAPLLGFSSVELAAVAVPNPSEAVRQAVGTPSVAEAAALLASQGGVLLAPKRASRCGTVALARRPARPSGTERLEEEGR